ncbi:50S ribosomal protein L25 [compost metagenome]
MPLHFVNAEISPAVKLAGAIISHVTTELEITCLPKALPQFIEVDLTNILAGASIHLADIKLPMGVTYVPHGGEDNPLLAAAIVKGGAAAADAEAAAPAA